MYRKLAILLLSGDVLRGSREGGTRRMQTLAEVIELAIESLNDEIEDGLLDSPYPEDRLHEIADGAVPVYTSDVFMIAANSPEARYVDDPGLVDPERGAEHVIQVAIYEQVHAALWKRLEEAREEAEDEDLCDECGEEITDLEGESDGDERLCGNCADKRAGEVSDGAE